MNAKEIQKEINKITNEIDILFKERELIELKIDSKNVELTDLYELMNENQAKIYLDAQSFYKALEED